MMKMFTDRFRPDAYAIVPIPAMNEIYVASSHHNHNSDTVFYTQHCDGPWSVFPFCHVYRCMVGRCRLTVTKSELKARLVSALDTRI
jgi:hypothetical protein